MSKILEGNEVEKEYDGGAGKLILDVNEKGELKISNTYSKEVEDFAKISANISAETSVFKILKKITDKTATPWDDKAVALLASLLGIVDESVIAQAKAHLGVVEAPQA